MKLFPLVSLRLSVCLGRLGGGHIQLQPVLKEKVFQLGQGGFLHTLELFISILFGTKDAVSRDSIEDYS